MEERYCDDYEEIDLREYLFLIWGKRYLIIGFTVLMILLAAIYSFYLITPVYQAETTLQLSNVDSLYSDPPAAVRLLKSNAMVMPVMNELNQEYTEADLQKYLGDYMVIENSSDTKIIDITLKNADPSKAKQILTGIIKNYQKESDIQYNRVVGNTEQNLAFIESNIDRLDKEIKSITRASNNISESNLTSIEKSILISSMTNRLSTYIEQRNSFERDKLAVKEKLLLYRPLEILNQPYVLEYPVSPNKKLNIAIATVLGFMIAVFLVFFIELIKGEETETDVIA